MYFLIFGLWAMYFGLYGYVVHLSYKSNSKSRYNGFGMDLFLILGSMIFTGGGMIGLTYGIVVDFQ